MSAAAKTKPSNVAALPDLATRAGRIAARMPRLFHMTEAGSGARIRAEGLWSTSALLTRLRVPDGERPAIEGARRPAPVPLPGGSVIRDNGVLSEARLARLLTGGLTPEDWYRLLNAHVFFWPRETAMESLLGARAYRDVGHDVLEFDTASLLRAHAPKVRLTPLNTGATGRTAPPRGRGTFRALSDWPPGPGDPDWHTPSGARRPIREVAVLHGVEDVGAHLLRVTHRKAGAPPRTLWTRPDVA